MLRDELKSVKIDEAGFNDRCKSVLDKFEEAKK